MQKPTLPVSGDVLKHLSEAFMDIPFNRMLGLQLSHLDLEEVQMSFSMKQELVGNFLYGILHGGVISSVLDMAGGMSVMAALLHKSTTLSLPELVKNLGKCSTVDLQISFLRPGKGNHFVVQSKLLKSGNKISFARMELYNDAKSLLAVGHGTYKHG